MAIYIDEEFEAMKELDLLDMAILSQIKGLQDKGGDCYASDEYFAEKFHTSGKTINNHLKKLNSTGYITVINPGSKNRNLAYNGSALDKYIRHEYSPKAKPATVNPSETMTSITENISVTDTEKNSTMADMTEKSSVNDGKNFHESQKKLPTIIKYNNLDDNSIPNHGSITVDSNNNTVEPSEPNPEWEKFLNNAMDNILPVKFMKYIRNHVNSSPRITATNLRDAIRLQYDKALILLCATKVCHCSNAREALIDELEKEPCPENEYDDIVMHMMEDITLEAKRNYQRLKG